MEGFCNYKPVSVITHVAKIDEKMCTISVERIFINARFRYVKSVGVFARPFSLLLHDCTTFVWAVVCCWACKNVFAPFNPSLFYVSWASQAYNGNCRWHKRVTVK